MYIYATPLTTYSEPALVKRRIQDQAIQNSTLILKKAWFIIPAALTIRLLPHDQDADHKSIFSFLM